MSQINYKALVENSMVNYTYNFFDVIGNIGVLILIGSYFALTAKKISSQGLAYPLMNLIAAILLTTSLYDKPNLSSLIIEFFWFFISLFGLYQFFSSKVAKNSASER